MGSTTVEQLQWLEAQCFEPRLRWSTQSWQADMDHPDRVVVTDYDGADLIAAASFGIIDVTAEVLRIMVAPDYRGRGIATRLLNEGLSWAQERGAERVMLEVATDNVSAIGLYESVGFRPVSRRAHYYGREAHADVMEWQGNDE